MDTDKRKPIFIRVNRVHPWLKKSSRAATISGDTDRLAVCATNTTEALNAYPARRGRGLPHALILAELELRAPVHRTPDAPRFLTMPVGKGKVGHLENCQSHHGAA